MTDGLIPLPPISTDSALKDVVPGLLQVLRGDSAMGFSPSRVAICWMIDGLGSLQLQEFASEAPFLSRHVRGDIEAPFPCVTPVGVTTLATGQLAGVHGVTGTSILVDGHRFHTLKWRPIQWQTDLHFAAPPESLINDAASDGLSVYFVAGTRETSSGLSSIVFSQAQRVAVGNADELAETVLSLSRSDHPTLINVYSRELDEAAHKSGVGSPEYLQVLRHLDAAAGRIATGLPASSVMVIVADHGIVNYDPKQIIDVSQNPELRQGVRWVGGNTRARHVYAKATTAPAVVERWRRILGDERWVMSKEEAIASGWFGSEVSEASRAHIGDVVVVDRKRGGIIEKPRPNSPLPVADHGSWIDDERLVPLITIER